MVAPISMNPAVATAKPTTVAAPKNRSFSEVLGAKPRQEPQMTKPEPTGDGLVTRMLKGVASGQREIDRIVKLAQGGRRFSPAQLLALQARIYRVSQELDMASKLVEKATNGVKQAMSTQV